MTFKLAKKVEQIEPFFVMALLARARELEAQGKSIVHMEIGEPDFATPASIITAGQQALADEKTHYTPALGLPQLRQKIADYYQQTFNLTIDAARIIITPGASGALQLALAALVDPGDKVLVTDPGYPCNRHMVRLLDGEAVDIAVDATTRFQLTAALLEANWDNKTKLAMVASPSNPTGTRLDKSSMQALIETVERLGGALIVDELYQGLVYDQSNFTALSYSDQVIVVNSFSKYFGMTGWRLGWLVVPDFMVSAIDKIAQNIFLAASTPAQYAALAAFEPAAMSVLQQRRDIFKERRDYLLVALRELGLKIEVEPEGAFYIYANCSAFTDDSFALSSALLEVAGVAVTPGKDFGQHHANQYLRFAYTQPIEQLKIGVERLQTFFKSYTPDLQTTN